MAYAARSSLVDPQNVWSQTIRPKNIWKRNVWSTKRLATKRPAMEHPDQFDHLQYKYKKTVYFNISSKHI